MKRLLKYFIITISLAGIILFIADLFQFNGVAIMDGTGAIVGSILAFTGGLLAVGFNSVWSKWTDDLDWN